MGDALIFHMPMTLEAVDSTVVALTARVEGHLPPEAHFRFQLCMSEVLTNLVLHGGQRNRRAPAKLYVELGVNRVEVHIHDPVDASPFDVTAHAPDLDSVDALAEGGRGLALIMECADAVDYGKPSGRRRLQLSFWRRE